MAVATVSGVVVSVNGTGSGFTVKETVESPTKPGFTWDRYWRCWFPAAASTGVPGKDELVTVSGVVAAKVSERNPKYVDYTLNDVRLEQRSAPAPVAAAASDDPWAAADSSSWDAAPIPEDVPW